VFNILTVLILQHSQYSKSLQVGLKKTLVTFVYESVINCSFNDKWCLVIHPSYESDFNFENYQVIMFNNNASRFNWFPIYILFMR